MVKLKKLPGISAVIPNYKKPGQVNSCINLLMKSKGLGKKFSLEIVIVDDSPDNKIKKLVDKFSKNANVGPIPLNAITAKVDNKPSAKVNEITVAVTFIHLRRFRRWL